MLSTIELIVTTQAGEKVINEKLFVETPGIPGLDDIARAALNMDLPKLHEHRSQSVITSQAEALACKGEMRLAAQAIREGAYERALELLNAGEESE